MLDSRIINSTRFQNYGRQLIQNSKLEPKLLAGLFTEKSNTSKEKIILLILKGFVEKIQLQNFPKAIENFQSIIRDFNSDTYPLQVLEAHLSLIEIKFVLGDVKSITPALLDKSDSLIKELKEKGMLEAELRLIKIHSNLNWHKGNYLLALEDIELGLATSKFHSNQNNQNLWEIDFLYDRSIVNYYIGQYSESIVNTLRSKGIMEHLSAEKRFIWSTKFKYLEFLVYRSLGEYELSLNYADQLKQFIENNSIDDQFFIGDIYSNLGMFQLENGNFLTAFIYLNKSLEIYQNNDQHRKSDQAILFANLGRILALSGDRKKANETYKLAFNLFEESESEKELVEKLCWLIDRKLFDNKLSEAHDLIKTSKILSEKHGSRRESIFVSIRYAKWLMATNEYEKARNAFIAVRLEAEQLSQYQDILHCTVFLAELDLHQLDNTETEKNRVDEILKNAEKAIYLASNTSYSLYLVRAMKIKAALLGLKLEYVESLYVLDDALSIAEEKSMYYLQGQLHELKTQLEKKFFLFSRQKGEIRPSNKLLSAIRVITGKKSYILDNFQRIKVFYLAIFGFKQSKFHVFDFDTLPPESIENKSSFDPMTIGLIFSTSLGQGNRYNQGLFGPLPTPDVIDFKSLIYSILLDKPQKSNPTGNYILIVINYHGDFDSLFYNRNEFEKYFNRLFKPGIIIEDINNKFFVEIQSGISALLSREIEKLLSKMN